MLFGDPAFEMFVFDQINLENFIDALAREADPNDDYTQQRLAAANCINLNALSSYEIQYIENEVAKRWRASTAQM